MDEITHKPDADKPVVRANNGRFLPGTRGGPGTNAHTEMKKFRAAALRSVTEGDVEQVVKKLVTQAKAGEIKAQTLLLEVIGVKVKHIDATIRQEVTVEEAQRMINGYFGLK